MFLALYVLGIIIVIVCAVVGLLRLGMKYLPEVPDEEGEDYYDHTPINLGGDIWGI